jgi:hypothetical protein
MGKSCWKIAQIVLLISTGFLTGCCGWGEKSVNISNDPVPIMNDVINSHASTIGEIKTIYQSNDENLDNTYSLISKIDASLTTMSFELQDMKERVSTTQPVGNMIDIRQKILSDIQKVKLNLIQLKANIKTLKDNNEDLFDIMSEMQSVDVKLKSAKSSIEFLKSEIADYVNKIERLEKENKRLNSKSSEYLNYVWGLLAVIGTLVLIGSLAMGWFTGNWKAGIAGAALGILVIAVASALIVYFEYIAVGGLVLIGGVSVLASLIGVIIWWKKKKMKEGEGDKEKVKKALEEVVETTEITKDHLNQKDKDKLFGKGATPGVINSIQNPETKKMVSEIRQKNKTNWEPIIDKTKKPTKVTKSSKTE